MANSTASKLKVDLPSDLEIRITRTLEAPRQLVWEAMTTPEHVKQWWGLRGSTLEIKEMDLRPGGTWRFISRNADGAEHPFAGTYREIVPPERIVQTFIYDVPPINQFESVETMTLREENGHTIVTVISRHGSKEARDGMLQSGMEKGAAETYDRLEELLAKLA